MTYTEAVARIRELSRVTDFSIDDTTLGLYYNQALDEIAEEVGGFYYEADLEVPAALNDPATPQLVFDSELKTALRCWWKYDTETEFGLIREVSFMDLPDAGEPGEPGRWAQYEDDIYIYPAPDAPGTLRVRGMAWRYHADETWTSDELQLPRVLHMAAVHRTASMLCDTNDDFERSARQMALYGKLMSQYRLQRDNENADIGFEGSIDWRRMPFFRGTVN